MHSSVILQRSLGGHVRAALLMPRDFLSSLRCLATGGPASADPVCLLDHPHTGALAGQHHPLLVWQVGGVPNVQGEDKHKKGEHTARSLSYFTGGLVPPCRMQRWKTYCL